MIDPILLKNKEIDKMKWDACIAASPNPVFFLYSSFLDIRCKNWQGLVWGDYKSVMAIPVNRKKILAQAYTPFFIQQLGPVPILDNVKNGYNVLTNSFQWIQLRTSIQTQKSNQSFPTTILHLNNNIQEIRNNYSTHLKRAIKKSSSFYLTFDSNVTWQEAISHFSSYVFPKTNLPKTEISFLNHVLPQSHPYFQFNCVGARNTENGLESCAIIVVSGHLHWAWVLSSSEEGKNHQAMAFLLDKWFELNNNKEILFDFEGSSNPGISRFYKSFGAEEIEMEIWK